jgi:hypothetical protein
MVKGKTPPRFLAVWASIVICFLLGFVQVRAYRIGLFATVPVSVMIAQHFWNYALNRFQNALPVAYLATGLVGLLMFSPVWLLIGSAINPAAGSKISNPVVAGKQNETAIDNRTAGRDVEPVLCNRQSDYAYLAKLPKANIFNAINNGPAILVFTDHNVVGGNYHRNGNAILDIQRFFASEQDIAFKIIKRRNTDYVMMCDIGLDPAIDPQNAKLMGPRLLKGDLPEWLEKISPTGADVMIYRFDKTAGQNN